MMLLVIGAQKSATSTLHRALAKFEDLEVLEKELGLFDPATDDSLDTTAALKAVDPSKTTVEIATRYSMLPEVHGVVDRASSHLLPTDVHIAYLARHPLDRLRSHLEHDELLGRIDSDWDQAVRNHPRFVNNSRAAMQLEPWIEFVGRERVHVIRFDDLVSDTAGTCSALRADLGLPGLADVVGTDQIWENRTSSNPRLGRTLGNFLDSQFYRRRLRPLVPSQLIATASQQIRDRSNSRSTSEDRPPASGLQHSTIQWLVDELSPDVERFNKIVPQSQQWWTAETLQIRHAEGSSS